MLSKSLCVAGTILVSTGAFAANVLGTASSVQGLVTVSNGANMATVTAGAPVLDGSRYLTGSGSFASLRLSNGCVLNMKPNQSITIDGKKSCDELLALLETSRDSLAALQGTGGGAGGGMGSGPLIALGGLIAAGLASGGGGGGGAGAGGGGTPEFPISTP